MTFLCLFASADPFLGKIDKHSLPQQTLMELLIEKVENRSVLHRASDDPVDISEWCGLTLKDPNTITEIHWWSLGLRGFIPLKWLPFSLKGLFIFDNMLTGTADLTCLPEFLMDISLADNALYGTVDLTQLPETLMSIDLSSNDFSGKTDFGHLPESLTYLNIASTELQGKIVAFIGELVASDCRVEDLRVW